MASMAEVNDDNFHFFKDFLSNENNKELVSMLRAVVNTLGVGLEHSSVASLRVIAANANSCVTFNKAAVDVEVIRDADSSPVMVPYALFFVTGLEILADFFDKHHPKIPENLLERRTLQDLLQFLFNSKEQPVLLGSKSKGITLAQHLFLPLVQNKSCLINSFSAGAQLEKCCQVDHPVSWEVEDTSFGCPSGWHGRADIILKDNKVPITVVENQEDHLDSDVVSVTSDSSVVVKTGDMFSTDNLSQITAQTIAYSFVQQKKHPMSSKTFVPGIGICSNKLIVYLYDCIGDILVATGPIDLYTNLGGVDLNTFAIIILWLALNHNLFGNKTPEDFKDYTANFHHILGPSQLKQYKTESSEPCEARLNAEDLLKFWEQHSARFKVDVSEHFPAKKSKIDLT